MKVVLDCKIMYILLIIEHTTGMSHWKNAWKFYTIVKIDISNKRNKHERSHSLFFFISIQCSDFLSRI